MRRRRPPREAIAAERVALPLVAIALALAWPHRASARAPAGEGTAGYELRWDAPPGCPDADAVRSRIDAWLVGAPARGEPPIHAAVQIEAVDAGLRLRLETSEATGVRELIGRDCGELVETAALIVAIAVDPRVLARIDDPVPPPVAEPPPPPSDDPPPPSPTTPAGAPAPLDPTPAPIMATARPAPARTPPVALAIAQAGLDVGGLPGPTAHVGAAIGLLWPRARALVEGDYVARRSLRSSSNADVTVLAQAWSVGLRGCAVAWQRRRLSLPVCGIARGGLLYGRGDGALVPRSARQPWAGVGPGVLLVAALRPRLALVFGLDALVAVVHGGFRTNQADRFAQPWPVVLQVSAGIQLSGLTRPGRGGQPRR